MNTIRQQVPCTFLFLLAACSSNKQPEPLQTATVNIGQLIDRTGSIATPSWSDSIRLAVGTANEALKQAGRTDVRFALVEANSGNAPDLSRAGALELVKKSGAKAIITDSSQDDIAVNMLMYDGDPSHALSVPVICMACTSPAINNPAARDADPVKQAALRNGERWNFRTTMSDAYQAQMLAHWLVSLGKNGDVNGDGRFKLSVYASDDPYGHGFSDSIKARVLELHHDASIEQIFHDVKALPADYDWGADVAKLADEKNETNGKIDGVPDAVVTISFPKFEIAFTKAWLEAKTNVRLVHTHNFRAARVLEVLGPAVEGEEGTSQAVLGEGLSASIFSDDLRKLNGQAPAFRDAPAYDAAMSLMLATLKAAQKNGIKDLSRVSGAQIRDAMWAINDAAGEPVDAGMAGFAQAIQWIGQGKAINYRGASGPCDFDAHGDVITQLARFRVERRQFVDVEKFACGHGECRKVTAIGSR